MTKREPKDKLKIPTRTARPKGDMFQNLRRPEEIESLSIEEIADVKDTIPPPTPSDHQPPPTTSTQELVGASNQNLVVGGGSEVASNAITSDEPKTSFKTKELTTDDEHPLVRPLKEAERVLTGKNSTQAEKWAELAELHVVELQIAAARTGQVSNVPAFLTEHLRRRLWKKDKAQLERESREAASEPKAKQDIDASKCPDCGGSGWWYPEGTDRGVAKCKHAQLLKAT
jgi:hypothetical protein